jgi:hypothetical protein
VVTLIMSGRQTPKFEDAVKCGTQNGRPMPNPTRNGPLSVTNSCELTIKCKIILQKEIKFCRVLSVTNLPMEWES